MPRPVTFVHTADLHLDAPFQGIHAEDARVRDALVESTYRALDRVVALAEENGVDFVAIAGDAYNNRDKSLRAQMRFAAAMSRLAKADIPVLITQGNHDPADGWSAGIKLPDTVHYFSTTTVERIPICDSDGAELCAVYGRGYATGVVKDNLAVGFRRNKTDETAIGVLHANVGGQVGYEPYAPCSLDDLRASGFDYWALGHIHKPMDLADVPRIRYAGSPQGLNPKENGPHGCWLVTMERGQVLDERFVETDVLRWARRTVDATELNTIDDVRAALRAACEEERESANGRPVIARIDLTGRTEAHADLVMGENFAELIGELRDEQMEGETWLWLDRVRDLTSAMFDLQFLRGVEDFSGDLVRITDTLLADPEAAARVVAEALEAVDGSFGTRERDSVELLERARDACLDRLLGEASR